MRRRPVPRWLPAVAAALVVLAGIGVVTGLRDDGSSDQPTAASGDHGGSESRAAVPGPDASTFATAVFDGGDLGDIDVHALTNTIEAALSPSPASSPQAAGSAASGASGDGKGVDDSAATTLATKTLACEDDVRAGNPDLGALLYRATGRLDGVDVEVFAFDGSGRRWVYVVATGDCAIKNQTTYSA
jgi:hypothetical protein